MSAKKSFSASLVPGCSKKEECLLCLKMIKHNDFPLIIEKALARKYSFNFSSKKDTKVIDMIFLNEK